MERMSKRNHTFSSSFSNKFPNIKCPQEVTLAFLCEDSPCYSRIFEVYYSFAYHLCCIPYKFQRRRDGRYILHEWWFQKVFCYLVSALFVYLIIFRFVERLTSLMRQTKWDNNNPLLYLRLIEASAYANLALTVNYTQSANKRKILSFLNSLQKYSANHHPSKRRLSYTRKLLGSSGFLRSVGFIIATVSLLNDFIFNNARIEFKETLRHAQEAFLWRPIESDHLSYLKSDSAPPNFVDSLLVAFYTMVQAIRGMKDMFAEGFFMVGIIPLWLISSDFSECVRSDTATLLNTKFKDKENKVLSLYLFISKLSRLFSNAFGHALLCYLAFYLMYYSTQIDTLFFPGTMGGKIYEMEYVCTFATIYGLGASFAYQMKSLQRFTNLQRVSKNLKHNNCALTNFLYSGNFCDIKAKTLSVNFSTLTEFISQVMVIFLICVQSKLQRAP